MNRTLLLLCLATLCACGDGPSNTPPDSGTDPGVGADGGTTTLGGDLGFPPRAVVWGFRTGSDGVERNHRTVFIFNKELGSDCGQDPERPYKRVAVYIQGTFDGGAPMAHLDEQVISLRDAQTDGGVIYEDYTGTQFTLTRADDLVTAGSFNAPTMVSGQQRDAGSLTGSFVAPFCATRKGF
jgi:predicted small lipoprotein YifL